MINSYFKTAARGLRKNVAHSVINMAGLSVGMAVAVLIGLWIGDELSFNTYHQHYDRIVQVLQKEKHLGANRVWDHLPFQLINELKSNYKDDFAAVAGAITTNGYVLTAGEK